MDEAAVLAAAIGGPIVGLAGILFAWLNSRGDRAHAVALAGERHEHERKLARGERSFEKRAAAYQELLRQQRQVMMGVERTHPIIGPAPDLPEPLSEAEWEAMYVQVAVLGSEGLMKAFQHFASKVKGFIAYAQTYSSVLEQGGASVEPAVEMNRYRSEAGEALLTVERQMRDDLAGL